MKFKMCHENYNVLDLGRSMEFYEKALGLKEVRRIEAEDGSFIIVYIGNETTDFVLELTWIRDRKEPYNLGDMEFHLAFETDDYEAALAFIHDMQCIVNKINSGEIHGAIDKDSSIVLSNYLTFQ